MVEGGKSKRQGDLEPSTPWSPSYNYILGLPGRVNCEQTRTSRLLVSSLY
jgi:hypothetical protein